MQTSCFNFKNAIHDTSIDEASDVALQELNEAIEKLKFNQRVDFEEELLWLSNRAQQFLDNDRCSVALTYFNEIQALLKQAPLKAKNVSFGLKDALLHNHAVCYLRQRDFIRCSLALEGLICRANEKLHNLERRSTPLLESSFKRPGVITVDNLKQKKSLAHYYLLQSELYRELGNLPAALISAKNGNMVLRNIFRDLSCIQAKNILTSRSQESRSIGENIIFDISSLTEVELKHIDLLRSAVANQTSSWEEKIQQSDANREGVRESEMQSFMQMDSISFVGQISPQGSTKSFKERIKLEFIYSLLYSLIGSYFQIAKNSFSIAKQRSPLNALEHKTAEINHLIAILFCCEYLPYNFKLTQTIIELYECDYQGPSLKNDETAKGEWKRILFHKYSDEEAFQQPQKDLEKHGSKQKRIPESPRQNRKQKIRITSDMKKIIKGIQDIHIDKKEPQREQQRERSPVRQQPKHFKRKKSKARLLLATSQGSLKTPNVFPQSTSKLLKNIESLLEKKIMRRPCSQNEHEDGMEKQKKMASSKGSSENKRSQLKVIPRSSTKSPKGRMREESSLSKRIAGEKIKTKKSMMAINNHNVREQYGCV